MPTESIDHIIRHRASGYMHYLYVIRSKVSGKYYVGETNDVARRFEQHQAGRTSFGLRNKDLEIVYSREVKDRSEAKKLEYFIKRQKSRLFIEKFIEGKIIPP